MPKRGLSILALILTITIVLSSVGFYELGFVEGSNSGYSKGYSQGSTATFISTFTEVKLSPNGTFYVSAPPARENSVAIDYGITVIPASGQPNVSAEMLVIGGGAVIFNTGYHQNNYGTFYISNATTYQFIGIFIRANPQNGAPVTLEFTSPLQYQYST